MFSRRVVFLNLQNDGEAEHEVKTLEFPQAVRLTQAWCKARLIDGYGTPYRVRLYRMNPRSPEACWFAELTPGDLEADPRTADYLNASLNLAIPEGALFVTYQLLSANVQENAHLTLELTFDG
jgi:hypothetical protein